MGRKTNRDSDLFFSEREFGVASQLSEELDASAWGGIVSVITRGVSDGSFADTFPRNCEDPGRGVVATDENSFWLSLGSLVPDVDVPLRVQPIPRAVMAMDVLQFAARHVTQATEGDYHSGLKHHHLSFDRVVGLDAFRRDVNEIFRRGGLAFAMDTRGQIERTGPPVLRERIASPLPSTGRPSLDARLARAIEKYRSPDLVEREEALEKLWDAWNELQTLWAKKPRGISALIDAVAQDPEYRRILGLDAVALKEIGNDFQIRHTETDRIALESSSQVDYLFGRMFNLIWLLLTALSQEE